MEAERPVDVIMDGESTMENLAKEGGVNTPEAQRALSELQKSLTEAGKADAAAEIPRASVTADGKLQYTDAGGKPIEFQGKSFGDFMTDKAEKVIGADPAELDKAASDAAKVITEAMFGIDSPELSESFKPRVQIELSNRAARMDVENLRTSQENMAKTTFSPDTLEKLNSSDPATQEKGAQQAAQEVADKLSKTTDDLNKRLKELETNSNELQQRLDQMVEEAKTPAEKEAAKESSDNIKNLIKLGLAGIAGFFVYSYLKNRADQNSGCFVTVYDATNATQVSYGKVSQLTCGEFNTNQQNSSAPESDQVLTATNCVKNADGSYPQPAGCPNNCYTDFNAGTMCAACGMDPDGGTDKVCTKYCNNAFMKSTNPKYVYKFNCTRQSIIQAAGQSVNDIGKLLADAVSAIWDIVKIVLYVLAGIAGLVLLIWGGIKIWEFFQKSKQNVETSQQLSNIDISEKDQKSKLNVDAYKQKQQLGGGESIEMTEIPKQSPPSPPTPPTSAVAEVVQKFGHNRNNKRVVLKKWHPM